MNHFSPEKNVYSSFASIFPKQKIRHICNQKTQEKIPKSATIKDLKFSGLLQYQVHEMPKDQIKIKAINDSQVDYYIQRKDDTISDWLNNYQMEHCIVIYENQIINKEQSFSQLADDQSYIELTLFDRQIQENEILVTVYRQEEILYNDVVNNRSLIINEIQNFHQHSQRSFYILSNNQIIQDGDTFLQKFGQVKHCILYILEYQSLLAKNLQIEVTLIENGEILDTKFINNNELILSALATHFNKQHYFAYHNGREINYNDTFSKLFQASMRCCLIIKSQSIYYQELLEFLDKFRDKVKQKLESIPQAQINQFNKNNEYYFENLHQKDFLARCQKDLIDFSRQDIIDVHIKSEDPIQQIIQINQPQINTPLFDDPPHEDNYQQDDEDPYAVQCVKCNQDILEPNFFKGRCNHSYHEKCFNAKIQAKIQSSQKLNIKCLDECNRTYNMKDIKQMNQSIYERTMDALLNQIKHNYQSKNGEFITQCSNEQCNFLFMFDPQQGYINKCQYCEAIYEEN